MMHRHTALACLLASLVAALCSTLGAAADTSTSADVIIIGSGMAGLGAATYLAKNSKLKSIVLEARDRAGGRTYTVQTSQGAVDLGAAWLHGSKSNALATLSQQQGFKWFTENADSEDYYQAGGVVPAALSSKWDKLAAQFTAYLAAWRKANKKSTSTTMQQVLDAFVSSRSPQLTSTELMGLRTALRTNIEEDYAADLAQLSALYYDQDLDGSGPDVLLDGGYIKLVDLLKAGVDIRYNQTVTRIDYTSSPVKVTTSGSPAAFTARYVLVTLPLGYLQAKHAALLSPALPAAKVSALQQLGMGLLNKVILVYNQKGRPFWADEDVLWMVHTVSNGTTWTDFYDVYKVSGGKAKVLIAFNCGSSAWQAEASTDQQLTSEVLNTLQSMFPGKALPTPSSVIVTRWGRDPYTLGAYSYVKAGAAADAYDTLAAAVSKKVFFAGEATHAGFPGTAHGAYLSGVREAKAIIKLG